jgi:hypothetical protein
MAIIAVSVEGSYVSTAYARQSRDNAVVGTKLPEAVREAIRLLRWSGEGLPRIEVVDKKPADASPHAEACPH